MRLVWTIKVYDTGGVDMPIRVKIEGTPYGYSQPWVNGSGKGKDQATAYREALASIKSGAIPGLLS